MKSRYKIIIIICLSFIPISIFFPQVFLIFHLDKYETNEICDTLNGTWDWFSNKCFDIGYEDHYTSEMCFDSGGNPSCYNKCVERWKWNYWDIVFSVPCHLPCPQACEFTGKQEIWKAGEKHIKVEIERTLDYIPDGWNTKWGPVPPVSKTEIEEIIINRGYIDLLANATDYLRETKNINIVTISTDHENHALKIGIDLKGLSDSEIKNIEKQIRKIVGDEINITIEHSEVIAFR